MVINTSALVAILFNEPKAVFFLSRMAAADVCRLSAASVVELGIVLRWDPTGRRRLAFDEMLHTLDEQSATIAALIPVRIAAAGGKAIGSVCPVGEPHVKHLEGKLWEIRAKGADGIARAIYVTVTGRRAVILHAFVKKSQKTPTTALAIARERAKQVTS